LEGASESLKSGSCPSRTQKDCQHVISLRNRLENKLKVAVDALAVERKKKKAKTPSKKETQKVQREEAKREREFTELERLRGESKLWQRTSKAQSALVKSS
jgi:hypothetical protein